MVMAHEISLKFHCLWGHLKVRRFTQHRKCHVNWIYIKMTGKNLVIDTNYTGNPIGLPIFSIGLPILPGFFLSF